MLPQGVIQGIRIKMEATRAGVALPHEPGVATAVGPGNGDGAQAAISGNSKSSTPGATASSSAVPRSGWTFWRPGMWSWATRFRRGSAAASRGGSASRGVAGNGGDAEQGGSSGNSGDGSGIGGGAGGDDEGPLQSVRRSAVRLNGAAASGDAVPPPQPAAAKGAEDDGGAASQQDAEE